MGEVNVAAVDARWRGTFRFDELWCQTPDGLWLCDATVTTPDIVEQPDGTVAVSMTGTQKRGRDRYEFAMSFVCADIDWNDREGEGWDSLHHAEFRDDGWVEIGAMINSSYRVLPLEGASVEVIGSVYPTSTRRWRGLRRWTTTGAGERWLAGDGPLHDLPVWPVTLTMLDVDPPTTDIYDGNGDPDVEFSIIDRDVATHDALGRRCVGVEPNKRAWYRLLVAPNV